MAVDVEARRAFWTTMRDFAARGKTVLFATHYLEEADAYADRAVLMALGFYRRRRPSDPDPGHGRPARTIRATLPDVSASASSRRSPASRAPSAAASRSCSRCTDSDASIRALLARYPGARDIEIAGAGLEEAFVELTGVEEHA